MQSDLDDLKNKIKDECQFIPSDEILDIFLDSMEEEITIPPHSSLIEYDRINTNVYCLKEGIIRLYYMQESKETTFGFASPGTLILSPLSFYLNQRAYLIAESCKKPATLLKMGKETFDQLVEKHHEFAKWMLSLTIAQICVCEKKLSLIHGTALSRYKAVMLNRSEIISSVSDKILSSYLDITPQHLCRIKKSLK